MKNTQNNKPDPMSEKDPVWDLLAQASEQKASPMFSRDVMRSIRLEEQKASSTWWKALFTPTTAVATIAVTCLALVATTQLSNNDEANSEPPTIVQTPAETTLPPADTAVAAFDEFAASYQVDEEIDDIISPLTLIATSDTSDFYTLEDMDSFLDSL